MSSSRCGMESSHESSTKCPSIVMLQPLCERHWVHTSCKLLQSLSQGNEMCLCMTWDGLASLFICFPLSFSSAGEICHSLLCRFTLELGRFQKEQENGAVKGWQCQCFHSRTNFAQERRNLVLDLLVRAGRLGCLKEKSRNIKGFCSHLPFPLTLSSTSPPSFPQSLIGCGLLYDSEQGLCGCR